MKKALLHALLVVFSSVFLAAILTSCGNNKDYTLSFSIVDRETGEQFMSLTDALDKGNEICNKYSKNHTQSSKFAGSQNDDGTLDNDQIVIYEFHEISKEDIEALKSEFEKTFPKAEISVSE